jgi:hypothetical protein
MGNALNDSYELTFDRETPQECYCGSTKCRGILGGKIEKEPSQRKRTPGKRKRSEKADVGYMQV